MMTAMRTICVALAWLVSVGTAWAHHGVANFDLNKEITIQGTVTRIDLVNPHSWLFLDATGDDGRVVPWRCELRGATVLRRSGWSPEMFKAGTEITITGAPDRFEPNTCYLGSAVFADGTRVDRYGQISRPAAASAERPLRHAGGVPNLAGDWAAEQRVLTDPRGMAGAFLPISDARAQKPGSVPEGTQAFPGTRGTAVSLADDPIGAYWNRPSALPLTDAGRKAIEGFDGASTDNPRLRCEPTNILFDWAFETDVNRIEQTADAITLRYGSMGLERTVHLNTDTHPRDIAASRAGHSIGRWEGDTLVVDTVGFESGILLADGRVPHSRALYVVERFTLDADGRALRRSFVATDPQYFRGEYRGSDTVYVADVPYQPIPCNDQSYKSDGEPSRLPWVLIGTPALGVVAGVVVWRSLKRRQAKSLMWALVMSAGIATVTAQTPARQTQAMPLALVGGTLIDGTGGPLVRNSVVLIRGERIEKVGTIQSLPVPAGYEHVSTEGMSVLPGLWDPHVHLVYAGYPNLAEWHKKYAAQIERDIMPATARQFLMSGVTSIRDLGAPLGVLDLRQRINRGEIDGPTVYAAGPFLASGTVFGTHVLAVKDAAEARAAVKRLIGAGVDIIKFSNAEQMAPGVARAIVDEAHQAGKRATAHGRTDAEIRIGLDAGVDEFQHIGLQSPQYPDDIVARIRERIGAGRPLSWSPTVGPDLHLDELTTNPEYLDDPRNFAGLPEMIAAEVRAAIAQAPAPRRPTGYQDIIKRKVGQLRALGVEFVFGSDEGSFGMTAAQATWRELDAWVRHLDIDPMTAIRKATLDAARYLGVDRETGSVSEGKYADVIAVAGNPLRHIDVLRTPAIVVKHGRRYK
jgi:imidazolonepropionase-like amidohydrolase